jgi:hypothetical protein
LLPVGLPDRPQRVLAARALRRPLHQLERLAEAPRDDCEVQLLLRAEEPEDVRLRDARPLRDLLGRGAVEAVLGEDDQRGVEDVLAPGLLRLAFRHDHALRLVMTY